MITDQTGLQSVQLPLYILGIHSSTHSQFIAQDKSSIKTYFNAKSVNPFIHSTPS